MSNNNPIFFISNRDRRSEFLIETRIWKRNNTFVVEKRAATPEARNHIKRMITTFKQLSKEKDLVKLIKIVPAKLKDDGVEFPFIQGISAERLLLENILKEHNEESLETINQLFKVIDALPSTKCNAASNTEYQKVFGSSFNKSLVCAKFGVIDLNLDNFVIDNNSNWHLYDYEWAFNFPIPKDLLKLRVLWYFFHRHREVLRYHTSRISSIEINPDVYIPKYIFEKYSSFFNFLDDLKLAETTFQKFATNKIDKKFTRIGNNNIDKSTNPNPKVGIDAYLDRATKEKIKDIANEHSELLERNRVLEAKFNRLSSSKSFKIARKILSVKRRLIP